MNPANPAPTKRGGLSVVGGTGGLHANIDEIFDLGVRYSAAARECRQRGHDLHRLLDPPFGLLAAALTAGPLRASPPAGGGGGIVDALDEAAFELRLLAAALGDIGAKLVGTALGYGNLEGHLFGKPMGGLLDDLTGLGRTLVVDDAMLLTELLSTHDLGRSAQAAVTSNPGQLDPLARDLLPGISLFDLLADDGRGVVRNPGTDSIGVAGTPPRSLVEILEDLAQRNDDGRSGEIDVRILTMPGGTRRAIVDITGTKSWTPLPTRDVTSLSTNARAVVGLPTAYEQGVLAAMRRAGVRSTDDVLMVGHSEGGMVAVNAARTAGRTGEFTVTHVVTLGSPVGRSVGDMPGGTSVLALENRYDVIPHLDGHANPDRRNVTTVTGRAGDGTISGDHDITASYEPIARATERSGSRSVRDALTGIERYFRAESVVTHTYQIERN